MHIYNDVYIYIYDVFQLHTESTTEKQSPQTQVPDRGKQKCRKVLHVVHSKE